MMSVAARILVVAWLNSFLPSCAMRMRTQLDGFSASTSEDAISSVEQIHRQHSQSSQHHDVDSQSAVELISALLPRTFKGDDKYVVDQLPETLKELGLDAVDPTPSCSSLASPFRIGDRVRVRNNHSEAGTYFEGKVTRLQPHVEVLVDGWTTARSFHVVEHLEKDRTDGGRIEVIPEKHYKLFLSVVAGKFGDDGDDNDFYGGDFFTTPAFSDLLRCYYTQILRDAGEIASQSMETAVRELKTGFHALAVEMEQSLVVTPKRVLPSEAVIRRMVVVMTRIKKLSAGEEVFFPCGWHGHAVYCEVQREAGVERKFTLAIFNSGDGVGYHYSISPDGFSQKYSPTMVYSGLGVEDLLHPTQLRAIVEPSALSTVGKKIASGPPTMYEVALGRLEKFLNEGRSTAVMMDSQAGGTCMVTGIHHFIHFKLMEKLPANTHEAIGKAIDHALQRAALEWFVTSAKTEPVTDYLPKLELFSRDGPEVGDQQPPLPIPSAAFHHLVRQKMLLKSAARQVMMQDQDDFRVADLATELDNWLNSHSIPLPRGLLDQTFETTEQAVQQSFQKVSFSHPPASSTTALPPSMRTCRLPSALLPASSAGAAAIMQTLTNITVHIIDSCFGETYVDWLASRILTLDLTELDAGERDLISKVYFQLSDQVRRFSSTQPFADHVFALKKLVVRFHELAGVADERRLIAAGMQGAPSLKDFTLAVSFLTDPVVTPSNLMYSERFKAAMNPVVGNEYTYLTFNRGRSEDWESLCKTNIHFFDSHKKVDNIGMAERDAAGLVGKQQKEVWMAFDKAWGFRSAETYVHDFMVYLNSSRYLALEHVNNSLPCKSCSDLRCATQPPKMLACVLSGLTTTSGEGISPDFFTIRKMLVEYHFLDEAFAARDQPFPHAEAVQPSEVDEIERGERKHFMNYEWCKSGRLNWESDRQRAIQERHEMMVKGASRHPTRASLRVRLPAADENAVLHYIFRESRPTKWQATSFKPQHDGDNAVVLYDLAHVGTDKALTVMQRTLFEIGMHPSVARTQWLGHLQEHPNCFLDAVCRVTTDAILFSDKFSPSTCTGMADTPDSYFQQVIEVLKRHKAELVGEPDETLLVAASYLRVTRHRLRARLGQSPNVNSAMKALRNAADGLAEERERQSESSISYRLQRLQYTLNCMELLVVAEMHEPRNLESALSSDVATECIALFMHVSAEVLTELDPAAFHQAVRIHGSLVQRSRPHMCRTLGGNFTQREFPLLQCGRGALNMLSGTLTEMDTITLEHHHLPSAVREHAFAGALTRMTVSSFGYVSDDTARVMTASGDTYFLTQSASSKNATGNKTEAWQADVFVHRQASGSSEILQLLDPCIWTRNFLPQGHPSWEAESKVREQNTMRTDLRKLLLGDRAGNAFCWVNERKSAVHITHVDGEGADTHVLTFSLRSAREVELEVHAGTPVLPQRLASQPWHFKFADLWLETGLWQYDSQKVVAIAEDGIAAAGMFTRFHEGRPALLLDGGSRRGSAVVFPGVTAPGGTSCVALEQSSTNEYEFRDAQEAFGVVDVGQYKPEERYLLEHGVPHLLLQSKSSSSLIGRAVMLPLPRAGAGEREPGMSWELPVRRASVVELSTDGTGTLKPKTREDRLAVALIMLKAKNFDHAFKYMADVYHLTPWTDAELFFLRQIASISDTQRDGDTSYLRLYAIKLIRDECLRFAVAGCERRIAFDDEEWLKAVHKSMDLALQTKHMVPIYRTAEMRTFTLTRFFASGDLETDPDGFRGWLLGDKVRAADLTPKRTSSPTKKASSAVHEVVAHRDQTHKYFDGTYADVFPSKAIEMVNMVQEHYQSIKIKIASQRPDSTLALLFCWLQPIGPDANIGLKPKEEGYSSDEQTTYQLALLMHIYEKRTQWDLTLLQPLAEAWLFVEDMKRNCNNCAIMHGLLQVMVAVPPDEPIEFFEAMKKNIGSGAYDFKKGRSSSFGEPAKCCTPSSDRTETAAVAWTEKVQDGAPYIIERPYNFKTLSRVLPFGFPSRDVSQLPECSTKPPKQTAAQALDALLKEAYGYVSARNRIYQNIPPETQPLDRADVLVTLYAESGDYNPVFPVANSTELHCLVQDYLLAHTQEAHAKRKLKRNFEFSQFSSADSRALLVFEYKTGIAIRESQVQQLHDLLTASKSKPRIQQIMMGGGKTSVLSPILLHSGTELGAFMSPPAVFSQNAADLTGKTVGVFDQRGFVMTCERSTGQQKLSTLRWVRGQLQDAIALRKYVVMVPKTLLCFQNLLVMNMGAAEEYGLIMEILDLLRTHATAIIDEIDTIFDPNTEVNFPLSHENTEKDTPVMHFLSMVYTLDAYPGEDMKLQQSAYDRRIKKSLVRQLIANVKGGNLPFVLVKRNPESIRTIAADLLACSEEFFITGELVESYRDSSGETCATNRNMRIIHLFLKETLPQVIRFRRNIDYGRSHVHSDQAFVIPYAFANKPVEGSKFSNYLLAVGLSFQYWFESKLDAPIFSRLIRELRKLKARGGKGLLASVYEHLESRFPSLAQTTSEQLKIPGMVPTDVLTDIDMIVACIGQFVLPRISVSASQVTNFALNMDASLKHFTGFSGTIGSSHIFPSRATVVEDDTVESRLRQRTVIDHLPTEHIFSAGFGASQAPAVEPLVSGKFAQTSALLDCGAFLRDFRNEQVAQRVLEVRSNIKAVIYYDDVQNKLVGLHRSGEQIMGGSDKVLQEWNLQYQDIFLYLDQQHTVGTDVRLGPSAVAVLTISKKTNLEELMQAIMRMRNYQGVQTPGELQDVLYIYQQDPPASLAELWQAAKDNTVKLQESTQHTVDRRKANAMYRKLFLEKRPPPMDSKSRTFTELVFQREHDFLNPEDNRKIGEAFAVVDKTLPFNLSTSESNVLKTAVHAAVESAAAAGGGSETPETEEELEMELEQEAEMQVERLRNSDDLNENSFTNNPVQWPPLYALCSEASVKAATKYWSTFPSTLHACAPVGTWLANASQIEGSKVLTSYSFALARPSPMPAEEINDWNGEDKFNSKLLSLKYQPDKRREESKRKMNFFEDPWTLPYSDEAQAARLKSDEFLLGDARKNVRSVAFMYDKADASSFQFVLLTSMEARDLGEFCHKHSQAATNITVPDNTWKTLFWSETDFKKKVMRADECEDRQRKDHKKTGIRHDFWQQLYLLWDDEGRPLERFLNEYWLRHGCSVITPTALPKNYLSALLPPSVLTSASPLTKRQILSSLTEVLALAGAVEVLERPEFKAEFFQRMQNKAFGDAYRKVREMMGNPMDPADSDLIYRHDKVCKDECRTPAFKFKARSVGEGPDAQTVVECDCDGKVSPQHRVEGPGRTWQASQSQNEPVSIKLLSSEAPDQDVSIVFHDSSELGDGM